jgi:hypothetical protein
LRADSKTLGAASSSLNDSFVRLTQPKDNVLNFFYPAISKKSIALDSNKKKKGSSSSLSNRMNRGELMIEKGKVYKQKIE